jgi:hypothetical protein
MSSSWLFLRVFVLETSRNPAFDRRPGAGRDPVLVFNCFENQEQNWIPTSAGTTKRKVSTGSRGESL